jgi:hypothetical protein
MEGGAEADTNVTRIETLPGAQPDDSDPKTKRIAAPVGRAGARIGNRDRLFGGVYVLALSGLVRRVGSDETPKENVMLYAGDARWLHAVGSRPVALGAGVTAADSLLITGGRGARTFRNLGADALVVLGAGDDRHLTLAVGGRDFKYKEDSRFSWRGPVANARLDFVLWQTAAKTRTLELATTLDFEARTYASNTYENLCEPGASPNASCVGAMTTTVRADRFQRASIDLNWTGDVVVTGGYQLTVVDSNSYTQSLIRHRIVASVTAELIDKLFTSATATLQLDQYPDGPVIEKGITNQEFTSLDDENRSSLQLRLARQLSTDWSLEARGAIWRNFDTAGTGAFRRELVYAGVVYSY